MLVLLNLKCCGGKTDKRHKQIDKFIWQMVISTKRVGTVAVLRRLVFKTCMGRTTFECRPEGRE